MTHYRGLPDANILVTPAFEQASFALEYAIETGEILCFYGNAGHGKSFAVETLLAEYPEVESHIVDFPGRPSPKGVAAGMGKQLTGITQDLTLSGLNDALIDVLSAKKRVIVIDEAQRLGHEALEFLRHLHDEVWRCKNGPGAEGAVFTLVLVGGNGCFEVLNRYPMLRSRVSAWIEFAPLSEDTVVDLIRQFHPLYHNVDEVLLRLIDEEAMHGNLRDWSDFTRHALFFCKRTGSPLTEEIARNVFAWRDSRAA